MSALFRIPFRSLLTKVPARSEGALSFALPENSITASIAPEQVTWWCSGKLNKTTKLARKKARRRAGERVPMRYR